MARKVNPISVRLNSNYHSDSSWFSDYCYGKLLYQDVDFRYFFRSIFPRILGEKRKTKEGREKTGGRKRKTRGRNRKVDLRLGRCIIHHFPKRTFIHVFFFLVQRRPPLFFGRRHRRRRQSRLTDRRAIGKGREEGGLLGENCDKASENSRRPLATAPITPLVVQYFFRMKHQIHSDPTMVNIIDDNLLFLSSSLLSFSYGKDAARRSDKMRNVWGRFAEGKLCLYIGNALCEKARNLCCQYYYNRDARCECTKPREKDLCSSYSSSGEDARRRLYIANARFRETKKVCSYCCWKRIKPWWPEMQLFLSSETSTNILIKPVRADFSYQSASLIAQEILWGLEKKKSFVQICTSIFQQIENCECVKGIRICCSGRLNGAEIAQTECMKYGSTSLHVFSDYIGYARAETFTRYGTLGVKVWISYSKHVSKNKKRLNSDAVSKTYKVLEMLKGQM